MPWLTFPGFEPPLHLPLFEEGQLPLDSLYNSLRDRCDRFGDPLGGKTMGGGCAMWPTRDGFAVVVEGSLRQGQRNRIAVNGQSVGSKAVPLRHGDTFTFFREAEFHDPSPDASPLPAGAEGLFRSILDNPADEAVRLILADWLDEQNTPETAARAEFIRLQCDLARDPPLWPDDPRLEREHELLGDHDLAWAGPILPGLVDAWEYRRGFVEAVTVDVEALSIDRNVEALFGSGPVRDVRLAGAPTSWEAFPLHLHPPQLEHVEGLGVAAGDRGQPFSYLDTLSRSREFPNLRRLELRFVPYAGNDLLERIRSLEYLRAPLLTGLCLTCVDPSAIFLPEALELPACRNVTGLRVEGRGIGTGNGRWFARAPCLPNLVELELPGCNIGHAGLELLIPALPPGKLRRLNLERNNLASGSIHPLLESPAVDNLTDLGLASNLTRSSRWNELAEALARAKRLANLVRLDLRNNGISDGWANKLVESSCLPNLRLLNLENNRLSKACRASLQRRCRAGVRVLV